jgi:two-component system sensor histidine kinase BaeS
MKINHRNSLWYKLVGTFAAVTLFTLAIALISFYLVSQAELDRFLEQNSNMVGTIVRQAFPNGLPEPEPVISGPDEEGVISVTVPLENAILESTAAEGSQFMQNLRWAALILVSIAAGLALLFGTLLFRQITRPLSDLQNSALEIAKGDLATRVAISTEDEVGQVGQAFNQMADKLENVQRLRRQMVADIAHELRTPLSVIRGNLEAMLDGLIEPEPGELADVHEEVMRLTRLTEDLRLLSLADAGQLSLVMQQIELCELIKATLDHLKVLAENQRVLLESDISELTHLVPGDPDKLKQALINLIENAIRFTPPGSRVLVKAYENAGKVNILVIDGGPGIPPEDQPFVFERFWRGDSGRDRADGGSGLGLSIVKEIVSKHGGSVAVDSPPGGPCTFTIELPY